jgi:MFS family permease
MRDYGDNLRLFNRNIRFFLLAAAVHGFVFFGIYALLLNLYLLRLGYVSKFIGLVNGIGPLMLAVFSLPAGLVSGRWGSRRVMLWSYFVLAVSFGLTPLSEILPETLRQVWIVVTYAGGWIGGAFAIVNFAPYLMAWTGEQERSYAFALQSAAFPVAGFLGSLIGGALPNLFAMLADLTLDSPHPYRNALLVAAVVELMAVWAIRQTAEIPETNTTTTSQTTSHIPPPYRLMFLFALVSLLTVGGEWTMRVYFNVYLDSELTVPTALIGALSAGALLMGLAAFLSPQAAARWGRNRLILTALFCYPVAFLPLIFIPHWLAVGLGYMLLIATVSIMTPTYLVFSQSSVEPQWRTAVSSAISMSIGLGIALTSLTGGSIIASYSFQTLFIIGAIAPLIGAIIFWYFFRPHHIVTPRPPVVPEI